jgi:hypothetical protein
MRLLIFPVFKVRLKPSRTANDGPALKIILIKLRKYPVRYQQQLNELGVPVKQASNLLVTGFILPEDLLYSVKFKVAPDPYFV